MTESTVTELIQQRDESEMMYHDAQDRIEELEGVLQKIREVEQQKHQGDCRCTVCRIMGLIDRVLGGRIT